MLQARNLKRGPKGRYFGVRGGFELAARATATLTAAHSVGIALGTDVDSKTVRKWKVFVCQGASSAFRVLTAPPPFPRKPPPTPSPSGLFTQLS